ncbi:MAG: hypothetical protein MZV63_47220 [Marinilabiliales bacterium]|nr:hypothetical protein [Marinilabiliales bacterium]
MPTVVLATANVTVNVAPALDVTATVDDNLIGLCPSSVAHLSATATGGEGAYTYLWDNAGTLNDATLANPTAKPGRHDHLYGHGDRRQRLHRPGKHYCQRCPGTHCHCNGRRPFHRHLPDIGVAS